MFIRTFGYDHQSYRVLGDVPASLKGGQEFYVCGGFGDGAMIGPVDGCVFSRAKVLPSGWPRLNQHRAVMWDADNEIFVEEPYSNNEPDDDLSDY